MAAPRFLPLVIYGVCGVCVLFVPLLWLQQQQHSSLVRSSTYPRRVCSPKTMNLIPHREKWYEINIVSGCVI